MSANSTSYYHRNLPHWHPSGVPIFFTFQLYGSLPAKVIKEMRAIQMLLVREISNLSEAEQQERRLQDYKRMFARIDAALDRSTTGHLWLARPEIALMVEDTLLTRYSSLYKLWAYVVMANHVHLLITPKTIQADRTISVGAILQKLKGYTAHEANRILGRTGTPFWQEESFDHWSRDDDEFDRIVAYIENNPVKAGLVNHPEDWKYSSAAERKRRGWTIVDSLT